MRARSAQAVLKLIKNKICSLEEYPLTLSITATSFTFRGPLLAAVPTVEVATAAMPPAILVSAKTNTAPSSTVIHARNAPAALTMIIAAVRITIRGSMLAVRCVNRLAPATPARLLRSATLILR